jgi:hypothetical protein
VKVTVVQTLEYQYDTDEPLAVAIASAKDECRKHGAVVDTFVSVDEKPIEEWA